MDRHFSTVEPIRVLTRNAVIYEGPSQLTGDPIYVVATARTSNRKIGAMVQLWILPQMSPVRAVQTGADAAVCGDCKFRGPTHDGSGRGCYVEWFRAPEHVWQAIEKADDMTPGFFAAAYPDRQLRIGAYGDPVAVPLEVWTPLLKTAAGWTAYTHQWRRAIAAPFRSFCMASVDTAAEYNQARAEGWRTFRVRGAATDPIAADEVICPASDEAGHRVTCAACSLCRGVGRHAKNVVIAAHGQIVKHARAIIDAPTTGRRLPVWVIP